MDVNVARIKFYNDFDGSLSHIVCYLHNNKLFDIEIFDFYCWLIDITPTLEEYSKNFENWDDLTEDLNSLGFDFTKKCQDYINSQFSESEIMEFVYN